MAAQHHCCRRVLFWKNKVRLDCGLARLTPMATLLLCSHYALNTHMQFLICGQLGIQFFFEFYWLLFGFFYYYLSPFTSRCWVSHAVQCFITCEICLHPMMFFETVLHTKKALDAHCGLWLPKCVSLSCFSRGFYLSLTVNFCICRNLPMFMFLINRYKRITVRNLFAIF